MIDLLVKFAIFVLFILVLPGVSCKYTKLVKHKLKLITSSNTKMQLLLNSTQSNLNFEPTFDRIR